MNKFLFFLLFLPTVVFAGQGKGEKLLNRLWEDLKAGKIDKVEHYTSKHFQAITLSGFSNRTDFLNFYRQITILGYTISDVKVTEGEKVIVVTYKGSVNATCNNVVKKPSFVTKNDTGPLWMEVFKKFGKKWRWVAHGEPTPLQPQGN